MKLSLHPLALIESDGQVRSIPLDQALIARLQVSMNEISAKGDILAAKFYEKLFTRHPALRSMFPADMKGQQAKLTSTLSWAVMNLSKPAEVKKGVAELGQRHVQYGTKPEHYPIVCKLLLETMGEVAGDQWSSSLAHDWEVALFLLSELMQQH